VFFLSSLFTPNPQCFQPLRHSREVFFCHTSLWESIFYSSTRANDPSFKLYTSKLRTSLKAVPHPGAMPTPIPRISSFFDNLTFLYAQSSTPRVTESPHVLPPLLMSSCLFGFFFCVLPTSKPCLLNAIPRLLLFLPIRTFLPSSAYKFVTRTPTDAFPSQRLIKYPSLSDLSTPFPFPFSPFVNVLQCSDEGELWTFPPSCPHFFFNLPPPLPPLLIPFFPSFRN